MTTNIIALIGNPNSGKTTLFNKLTGSHQKVGNWPGVTVEKKTGVMIHQGQSINITDLPGVYSLSQAMEQCSLDERIAADFVTSQQADLYINIVDAANLKRNLYLTLQLIEMQAPMIVAVNMIDIANAKEISIDLPALSTALGCPVVPLIANKNQGIDDLKSTIVNFKPTKQPKQILRYPAEVETAITELQGDKQRWQIVHDLERHTMADDNAHEDCDILIADTRYQKSFELYNHIVNQKSIKPHAPTKWLDRIFTHKWLGIPIFFLVMYLLFELSMNLGTLLQPFFDISSTAIFIDGVNELGHHLQLPQWLTAIFSQGVGLGINTIVNFIPQIAMMYLFLAILEDSGYMARAAFVMDRFMQVIGLPGKSFVPLIVGFGCNVPSVLASRTLDSRRDRIMTCMMSPFMSCGARLAIFVVFASAFYPQHGGKIVFLLYIIGIFVAMITGLILNKTLLRGKPTPFILELPLYHKPNTRTIFTLTWSRLRGFVIRAGKIIIPVCMIIGSLNAIQLNGTIDYNGNEESVLSYAGKTITPILHPMGVTQENWPATVGLITGTLAKEVVVGTLNTLYSRSDIKQDNEGEPFSLSKELISAVTTTVAGFKDIFSQQMINPFTANAADGEMSETAMGNMVKAFPSEAAAFAYLLFVLLYIPCISTVSVLSREVGKNWAILSTFWSFAIAYTLAVIFYQGATFASHPISSLSWIIAMLLFHAIFFFCLRLWGQPNAIAHGT